MANQKINNYPLNFRNYRPRLTGLFFALSLLRPELLSHSQSCNPADC